MLMSGICESSYGTPILQRIVRMLNVALASDWQQSTRQMRKFRPLVFQELDHAFESKPMAKIIEVLSDLEEEASDKKVEWSFSFAEKNGESYQYPATRLEVFLELRFQAWAITVTNNIPIRKFLPMIHHTVRIGPVLRLSGEQLHAFMLLKHPHIVEHQNQGSLA